MEKLETALSYIQLYTGCNDHTKNRIKYLLESMDCFATENIEIKQQVVIKENIKTNIVKRRYIHKKSNVKPIEEFAKYYCYKRRMSQDILKTHSRKADIVDIRDKFCRVAYKVGYTTTEIGGYLNKHHTSIIHSLYKPH